MSPFFGASRAAKRRVIIDTDAGFDDILAILQLLLNPTVEVVGITISGCGMVHGAPGLATIQRLLHHLDRDDIPVAFGPRRAISDDGRSPVHLMSGFIRRHSENMLDFLPSHGDCFPRHASGTEAVDLLRALLRSSEQPVDILAIGPLTNIALALQQSPAIAKNIGTIFIMGGAVDVPGNIDFVYPRTPNKRAEFNFYFDPGGG